MIKPETTMKVFTCKGVGKWLESHAIIVAKDASSAVVILERKLSEIGVPQAVDVSELVEIDLGNPGACILCDGEY